MAPKRTPNKGKAANVRPNQPQSSPAHRISRSHSVLEAPQPGFNGGYSYEQMKILSLCILSRIAVMRGFFPNIAHKYLKRQYDPASPDSSYEQFLGSNNADSNVDNVNIWKVLPRGLDTGADAILNWLEQGISSAIELGYLKKFKLTVHSVDDGPISYANMIESYTMSFTYGSDPQIQLSSKNCTSSDEIANTLELAKKEVYRLVEGFADKVRTGMAGSDPLPGRCRIGMTLLYNEECRPDYEPPMFKEGNDETFKILEVDHTDEGLRMNTTHHGASVGWTLSPHLDASPPAYLQARALNKGRQTRVSQRQKTGRTMELEQRSVGLPGYNPRSALRMPSSPGETPTENARKLVRMQRHRSTRDPTQDTQPLHSKSLPRLYVDQANLDIGQPIKGLLPYTRDINMLIVEARRKSESQNRPTQNAELTVGVFCGCDSKSTAEPLIECELCATHQHYPCYGYEDERPRTHVCYRCLFQERLYPGGPLQYTKEIAKLCVKRRILYYIKNLGNPPQRVKRSDLSIYLGSDEVVTMHVTRSLAQENLLDIAPSAVGTSTTSRELICSIVDVDDVRNLFDPKKDIHHLLDLSNDSMLAFGPQSLYSNQSSLQPPPSSLGGSNSSNYRKAVALTGSTDDDSSTADDDNHFSAEAAPRQTRSSLQRNSQVKPLNYKRKLVGSAQLSSSKRSRFRQTGGNR